MQVLKNKDLQNGFAQIDALLSNVEVKGDSVQHIFKARSILKELYSQITEVEEKEEKETIEEGG